MNLTPTLATPIPQHIGARHDAGDGRHLTAMQIARETGCGVSAIHARIAKGWRGADLLRQSGFRLYEVGGERLSIPQIADRAGVATDTIRSRLSRGWKGRELLVKRESRREAGIPRGPNQLLACKLALAFPDHLPTTAQIRKVHPMSDSSAMRWRNALRIAREQLGDIA